MPQDLSAPSAPGNTLIPVNPNPTILGVTVDPMLKFRQHTDNINTKAKSRLNVLRALTHTKYGHSQEHITQVYKQFIRPILTYAHTAWQPLLKDTNLEKLQITQNVARLQAAQKQHEPIMSTRKQKS